MGSLDRACLPSALSSTWRLQVCGFQLSLLPRYAFGIGIFSLDMVSFQALYVLTMALASLRLPAFPPSVHAFGMVLSNLHMAALTPSALCLWHGASVLQALSLRCKVGARQFTPKFRHLELVGLQQFPQRPARSTLPCRGGSHGSAQVQCGNILSAWHVLGARLQCDVLRQLLATPRFAVRWPISFGEGLTLETARNSPPRP